MSNGYFSDAGLFLIDTVIGFYTLIVLLRFLLQLTRADFYNPVSQFIVRVTNPPLIQLRRIIPGFLGVDLAAIFFLLVLEALRLSLTALMTGHTPHISGLLVLSVAELLKLMVYVVIFSIFIQALLSWISTGRTHPMMRLLKSFTEPLLAPARRILPTRAGVDLSPIVTFLFLMLVLKLLVQPLLDLGLVII